MMVENYQGYLLSLFWAQHKDVGLQIDQICDIILKNVVNFDKMALQY